MRARAHIGCIQRRVHRSINLIELSGARGQARPNCLPRERGGARRTHAGQLARAHVALGAHRGRNICFRKASEQQRAAHTDAPSMARRAPQTASPRARCGLPSPRRVPRLSQLPRPSHGRPSGGYLSTTNRAVPTAAPATSYLIWLPVRVGRSVAFCAQQKTRPKRQSRHVSISSCLGATGGPTWVDQSRAWWSRYSASIVV